MSEINLDPRFSVFNLSGRARTQRAVINHRRTMNIISHEIENATLVDGARTRIFSAFQRMSRFLPQVERYRQMARQAEAIYVFGVMDCVVPGIENLYYVPLKPDDQLTKEWFLVSYGREYASALATEELTSITDPDNTRQFRGVWTFDPALTGILAEWLTRTVNANPYTFTLEEHNPLTQQRHIKHIEQRLSARINRPARTEAGERTKFELKTILDYTISQSQLQL